MQDICKAPNKTVKIDSNKSVTITNVNRLIPQINTKIIKPLKKSNDKIFIRLISNIQQCKKIERKKWNNVWMGSYQPKHSFVAILTSDQTDLGKNK